MWRRLSLLLLCCAVRGLDALEPDRSVDPSRETMLMTEAAELGKPEKDAPSAAKEQDNLRGGERQSPGRDALVAGAEGRVQQPTAEPLEEELDNQENIISQLLGDYDKVKTVSSGSDCVCRCIVRPIKRSDCSRVRDGDLPSPPQDSYTVETVTKGTDCKKCVCMAPASAVNPCEGEYRFKKLQEASKDDIKLATIIDLLEGSLYGMDLLKLHSVTTKLLTRVDNMEKAVARNSTERTREKERVKERAKEKEKERKAQQKKKKVNDLERAGQKSGAAAYGNKQKNSNGQLKKKQQQDGLEQQQPTRNKTGTQKTIKDKTEPKQPITDKNGMVIRGVTFYKAERGSYEEKDEKGKGKNATLTANASVDLPIHESLPPTETSPIKSPGPSTNVSTQLDFEDRSRTLSRPAPTQQPTAPPTTTQRTTTTTKPVPTTIKPKNKSTTSLPPTTAKPTMIKPTTTTQQPTTKPAPTAIKLTTESTTDIPPTAPKQTTTKPTTTSQQTSATILATPRFNQHPTLLSDTNTGPPINKSPMTDSQPGSRSRLSWTESPADQPKTTKKPAVCKDTVASISEPVQRNSYGFRDGAWMRDGRGHGNVIYLTNGHYGNNLLEFRDMDTFKSGQASNSYKLPYSFTGTGHVVFNGAFYYNRAFSRDVIRYDLRHRYVAAWTTLHDAILEEQAHRTQTELEFAVDESGLWLLYPALDTEGFHQEVTLLIHLRHRDLQPIQSFRTGLRRGRYGNSFLVCGVLYAVNSMEHRYANVTYAFDTHTLTHSMPGLAFTNMHAHTSQLAYCPLDKKLYAWDDGHQMTYDVVFAY
ncbi:olfactomedin-like protein 2B isoform X2 [Cebidichthys violaceus]|uniref:olfactomedin-like protein 2B isoform X2 n=1 Tax=Cebidichthys violaceus TaxID=271503 RepID=UPI0035CA1A49